MKNENVISMGVFEMIPRWFINALGLGSISIVAVLDILERYKSIWGFVIFFAVSISIKAAKGWQEYRHREEVHRQNLRQDEELHQKSLNSNQT